MYSLDSLMAKRLSFALKTCGFQSSSCPFFLLSFNLLVLILDFVYTWIYVFESGMRKFNKYTRRNVNNFNKPKCNNSTCQRVCIQIRTIVLSVLIREQTVCKSYQQITKVAADKKRVSEET